MKNAKFTLALAVSAACMAAPSLADNLSSDPRCQRKTASGHDVRLIERDLRCLGYQTESEGCMEGATITSVIQFQRANGLDATGVVDKQTQAALRNRAVERCETKRVTAPAPVVVAPPAIKPEPVPEPEPVMVKSEGGFSFSPLIEVGYAFLGEDLDNLRPSVDDGVALGQGIYGNLGAEIGHSAMGNWSILTTAGYKFGSEDGRVRGIGGDADTELKRTALAIIPMYDFGVGRVGAGLTAHINPSVTVDPDVGQNNDVDFDDAFGGVVRLDFDVTNNLYLGLLGEWIEYDVDSGGAVGDFDADNIGLHLGYQF